jgi:hypothetical protein
MARLALDSGLPHAFEPSAVRHATKYVAWTLDDKPLHEE